MYSKSKKALSVFLSFILFFPLLLPNMALAQDGTGEEKTVFIQLDIVPEEAEAKFSEFIYNDKTFIPLDGENKTIRHTDRETDGGIVILESYNTEKYTFSGWLVNGELLSEEKSIYGGAVTLTISECNMVKDSLGEEEISPCISEVDAYITSSYEFEEQYTVIPVFSENNSTAYKATVKSGDGGTANSVSLNGNKYQLSATPDEEHVFGGWLQNEETEYFSTEPQTQVEITADTAFIAIFEQKYLDITLLDGLEIVREERMDASSGVSHKAATAAIGERAKVIIPYELSGNIIGGPVTYTIEVIDIETEETLKEENIWQYSSAGDTGKMSVTIDPVPALEKIKVVASINDGAIDEKIYPVTLAPAEDKALDYLLTPNTHYMARNVVGDKGPDIANILSFIDEKTGELSVYAAATGGVLQLRGNHFEYMDGMEIINDSSDQGAPMTLAIGGTKDELVAFVKRGSHYGELDKYSLYKYTPSDGKWIEIPNSELFPTFSPDQVLVVNEKDIWTETDHWDGTKWTNHHGNFEYYLNTGDGNFYAVKRGEASNLYKYENNEWLLYSSTEQLKVSNIYNTGLDGTLVYRDNAYYTLTNQQKTEILNTNKIFSNTSQPDIHLDRKGDLYAFVKTRHYSGDMGLGGYSVYKLNRETAEWLLQNIAAFNDPSEPAIGTEAYLKEKVRPTSVTNIYNVSDKMSIFFGFGGAVYADFDNTTITYHSSGGSEIAPLTAKINSTVNAPITPTKADEYFIGWYVDEELTKAYSFDYMPAKNIELFAKWGDKPVDLTQAKATANQTIEDAYKKYNKRDYDEEGWSALAQAKDVGLAAIEAVTDSEDAVKTAMNIALEAIANIPLSENMTVVVSMEKFTLGQGYIIEPTLVTIPRNTKASKVMTDLLVQKYGAEPRPYEITGTVDNAFYLSHVKDGDHNYNIPQYIMGAIEASGSEFTLENDDWLGEFDFYYMSGWKYAINNVFPNVGASGWTLQNDQVMRWQYTLYGYGSDLNSVNDGAGLIAIAEKDNLTWRVAEINAMELAEKAQYKENYDKALAILQNMESTQEEVDAVLAALGGTERQGVEVTAEMPAEAKVIDDAINALPLAIKLSDKAAVEEIRAAYDALSPTLQQWIWKETLVLLTNAEDKIATLEQQVADIIEQITALPAADALTLADEAALNAMENEFSTLSDEQKALVTNADVLTQLSTKLEVLKGLDASKPVEKKTVENVIDLINVLPKEATLKLTDEAKVVAAKTAYDALSKEQQKQVTNYNKLATVLKKVATLKTAKANQKAVDKVIDAIDDLPSVSSLKTKDEEDLEDARKLYNALAKEQKALVTNLDDLKDLEKRMKELKSTSTTSSGGGAGGSKTATKPTTPQTTEGSNTQASSKYIAEQSTTDLKVVFTQAQMKELAAPENVNMSINGTAISLDIPQAVFTTNISQDAQFSIEVEKETDVFHIYFYEILSNGIKREITLPGNYVRVTFPLTLFTTAAPTASLTPIAQDEAGVILRIVDGEYKAVPHQIKNGEVSIYANANDEYVYTTETITFDDISKLANKADIEFLASRYVVNGTSDTTFEPNKSITRAQFGAMIARALNLTATEETHYADTLGKWYEADIQALYEVGITNAPGDFNPGATLSREHAAVFMYRVMEYIQKDNTPKATATAYADQAQINTNYAEAIATLNSLQIMQGKEGNVFDPKGHLTRAQMAKVLRKTLEAIDMM